MMIMMMMYQLVNNYSKCLKEYTNRLQHLFPIDIHLGFHPNRSHTMSATLAPLTTTEVGMFNHKSLYHRSLQYLNSPKSYPYADADLQL
jgi:hypothetical protein